jgi:hypothetical protein
MIPLPNLKDLVTESFKQIDQTTKAFCGLVGINEMIGFLSNLFRPNVEIGITAIMPERFSFRRYKRCDFKSLKAVLVPTLKLFRFSLAMIKTRAS